MGISPSGALEDFERSLSTLIDLAVSAINLILDGSPLALVLLPSSGEDHVIVRHLECFTGLEAFGKSIAINRPACESVASAGGSTFNGDVLTEPVKLLVRGGRAILVVIRYIMRVILDCGNVGGHETGRGAVFVGSIVQSGFFIGGKGGTLAEPVLRIILHVEGDHMFLVVQFVCNFPAYGTVGHQFSQVIHLI